MAGNNTDKKDPVNVRIGRNVSIHRGEMSQVQLAAMMTERGNKWSQATVWNTEQGNRPLKLKEAIDLAEVLSVSLDSLVGSETQSEVESFLSGDLAALQVGFDEATDGISSLVWAREVLGQSAIRALTSPESQIEEIGEDLLNRYSASVATHNLATALLVALSPEFGDFGYRPGRAREQFGEAWIEKKVQSIAQKHGIAIDPNYVERAPMTTQELRKLLVDGAHNLQKPNP